MAAVAAVFSRQHRAAIVAAESVVVAIGSVGSLDQLAIQTCNSNNIEVVL